MSIREFSSHNIYPFFFAAGRGLRRALRGGLAGRGQDILHPLRTLRQVHRRGGRAGLWDIHNLIIVMKMDSSLKNYIFLHKLNS